MTTSRAAPDGSAHFEVAIAELLAMWPRLLGARTPDSGSTSSRPDRTATMVASDGAAVSVEAVHTIELITAELHDRYVELRRLTGLRSTWERPPVALMLDELGMHRERAWRVSPAVVTDLDRAVFRWQRQARTTLRLASRPRRLPYLCPDHRAEHPTPLQAVDQPDAELHPSVVATAIAGQVREVAAGETALRWQRNARVRCPHCRRSWDGMKELVRLEAELAAAPAATLVDEVTHLVPRRGGTTCPCCGFTPFELATTDRITRDQAKVTCRGTAIEQRRAWRTGREASS